MMERVFVLIRPEAITSGNVGLIIGRIEAVGVRLEALQMLHSSRSQIEALYPKPELAIWLPEVVHHHLSGQVIAATFCGASGSCRSVETAVRGIRHQLAETQKVNYVHSSDTPEMSEREASIFFDQSNHLRAYSLALEGISNAGKTSLAHQLSRVRGFFSVPESTSCCSLINGAVTQGPQVGNALLCLKSEELRQAFAQRAKPTVAVFDRSYLSVLAIEWSISSSPAAMHRFIDVIAYFTKQVMAGQLELHDEYVFLDLDIETFISRNSVRAEPLTGRWGDVDRMRREADFLRRILSHPGIPCTRLDPTKPISELCRELIDRETRLHFHKRRDHARAIEDALWTFLNAW